MKSGQATQVYVVIGVIFFFGVVLGFKLIYDFIETSSNVRLMEFETRLKGDVQSLSGQPGTTKGYSYVVPYQTERVCFYDATAPPLYLPDNPLLREMVEEGKNVFLTTGFKIRGVSVANVKAPYDYYCFNVSQNRVNLLMEGKEGGALVKKAD